MLAEKVLKQDEVLNALEVEYRENHIYRDSYVNSSPTSVIVFTNMLDYLERIGDSCNNVAEVVVKINRYRKSDGYEEENFNN
ncbi:MAG: PhoU domain-containing protein [Eubacterium sp.]|nr:PhoU domain-containing protein [Eubacterium sp.]